MAKDAQGATSSARRQLRCGAPPRAATRGAKLWSLVIALGLGCLASLPVRATCIIDELGPDDQSGQKDLSKLCEPGPTCSASSLSLLWQLDDVNWGGNNTSDACALF